MSFFVGRAAARTRTRSALSTLIVLTSLLGTTSPQQAQAQDQDQTVDGRTVGLLSHDETRAFQGYTLFFPSATKTYLLDMNGQIVHTWDIGYNPGLSAYLLDDGTLLRPANMSNPNFPAGGLGGLIHKFAPDRTVLWRWEYSNSLVAQHHDVAPLPNGNILVVAWEKKSAEEAIQNGKNPDDIPEDEVWSDTIIEVKQTGPTTGEIVWKWDAFDHLIQDFDPTKDNFGVVADHPERINVNAGTPLRDWMHVNAVNYNAELNQIVISSREFSEFFVIDHSTTTEEAAGSTGGRYGKGGDILYRWGNPANYDRGTEADRKLFVQHDAQWIEPGLPSAGNMLVFNNGPNRPDGDWSSVEELVPPQSAPGVYTIEDGQPYGPDAPVWTYTGTPRESFHSAFISGAHRLPNGNTFITSGAFGDLFEVTPGGDIVWEYKNPIFENAPIAANEPIPSSERDDRTDNLVFRSTRLAPDHPALAFFDLTPKGTIELPPVDTSVEDGVIPHVLALHSVYPNPAMGRTRVSFTLDAPAEVHVTLHDVLGRTVGGGSGFGGGSGALFPAGPGEIALDVSHLAAGPYLVRISVGDGSIASGLIVMR